MREHRFPYLWNLADGYPAEGIESHGCKVFGTFLCGGGSSMGYKLAGYHHMGGVEIDPKVADIYRQNHNPELLYVEDLRLFNERTDLPDELYQLDVLDGSPQCSTFSMAGSREDAWGKKKKFAEGQELQTLDDLVFIYCNTIAKLQPKTFILENVKGLTLGNAKSYLKRVLGKLDEAGYQCQVFVLNAATMGVPQRRERAFVIGRWKDLNLPRIELVFTEKPIFFKEVMDKTDVTPDLTELGWLLFNNKRKSDHSLGDTSRRVRNKYSQFTQSWYHSDEVCPTLTTNYGILYDFPRPLNEREIKLCSAFPLDYKVPTREKMLWLAGMSVPPVMMAQISYQIYVQWLKNM